MILIGFWVSRFFHKKFKENAEYGEVNNEIANDKNVNKNHQISGEEDPKMFTEMNESYPVYTLKNDDAFNPEDHPRHKNYQKFSSEKIVRAENENEEIQTKFISCNDANIKFYTFENNFEQEGTIKAEELQQLPNYSNTPKPIIMISSSLETYDPFQQVSHSDIYSGLNEVKFQISNPKSEKSDLFKTHTGEFNHSEIKNDIIAENNSEDSINSKSLGNHVKEKG